MWELIRSNQRKSYFLLAAIALCLLALGAVIGAAVGGSEGAVTGMLIAGAVWIVMSAISFFSGDSILLAASHAQEVSPEIHPQLFNVVEEMKIAANLPAMPKVYIMDEPGMNAFATGIKPEKSAVAVTAGLLARLNRDELQGVIAHEISHILNRDVFYMTVAGIMLGSMQLIAHAFLRGLWYSGRSSRRYRSGRSSETGGQGQAILLILAIVFAVVGPILARIFYFSLSRKREYLADASGVRLTRYPEGLASALEKISGQSDRLAAANQITAPMYIVNPFQKPGMSFSGLASTHPPIGERVRILRALSRGVSYADYQKTYEKILGEKSPLIPPSGLADTQAIPIRTGSVEPEKKPEKKEAAREVMDLLRAVNHFTFLACACGLRLKIPPDFKRSNVVCPRCHRSLDLPHAEDRGEKTLEAGEAAAPLEYKRKTSGWESFACTCGAPLQLSPAFQGSRLSCPRCRRTVSIV